MRRQAFIARQSAIARRILSTMTAAGSAQTRPRQRRGRHRHHDEDRRRDVRHPTPGAASDGAGVSRQAQGRRSIVQRAASDRAGRNSAQMETRRDLLGHRWLAARSPRQGARSTLPRVRMPWLPLVIADHALGLPVFRALSLCTCRRHYPGAAPERIASLISSRRISLPR